MGTTYETLYSKVLLRLPTTDGIALLAAKEAVNTAHRVIARIQDFDELIVTRPIVEGGSSAVTTAGVKAYHIETDLGLTNPKDILSVRLMDEERSRKLEYRSPREVDEVLPYTDVLADDRSVIYTQRGNYLELIPTPDAIYALHIMYSQWPLTLSDDDDETSYTDIDDVIVTLAAVIAKDIINQKKDETGTYMAASAKKHEEFAQALLTGSLKEDRDHPDHRRVARPFNPHGGTLTPGQWWLNPFIRKDP